MWDDIDFETSSIHIRKSKTGTDRHIPMNEFLKNTLIELKSEKVIGKSIGTYNITNKNNQR